MAIGTASGWKLYIGGTTAADTESEFEALTWVEVGEIENLGDFGDESAAVTFASLSDSRVRKLKGARDAGTIALTCGYDPLNTGQQAMVAAEKTSFEYNIRIQGNDAPNEDFDPSEFYFRGLVMSARLNAGANDNVVRITFNVGINTPIIHVVTADATP